jgi:hypothetical protein
MDLGLDFGPDVPFGPGDDSMSIEAGRDAMQERARSRSILSKGRDSILDGRDEGEHVNMETVDLDLDFNMDVDGGMPMLEEDRSRRECGCIGPAPGLTTSSGRR